MDRHPTTDGGRVRRTQGFTLIELSVALAIAAVMFAAVVVGVGSLTGAKARGAAGELGGVIRSLYDSAALSGKTCRLVFELPPEKDEDGITRYWAECASGALTARQDRDDELKEDRKKASSKEQSRADDRFRSLSSEPTLQELLAVERERVENSAKYAAFSTEEIAPRELPSSVKVAVWTRPQRKVARTGIAYLYFFPQGFTEKAHVYVKQGNNAWTITVSPLTGKTAVVAEELEVPRS